MENLRAVHNNIVVRNIESEDKSKVLIVDFHDQTYLKGVVTSVGELVENVSVGDLVIHTDSVRPLPNVDSNYRGSEKYYLMQEDAIYCINK